ncbi:MAG: radical SAM protein [Candidatus Omnitrophica bacterium]|nr:radical SAM protein [Candidatus Omnitrophota bacterium]
MKTLLIHPPCSLDEKQKTLRFPLGIACLASYLKREGLDVRIYHEPAFSARGLMKILKDYRPDIVGLSCDSANADICFELSRSIKAADHRILVVLGGIHATYFHRQILEHIPTVDVVVRDEGEETLAEIISYLSRKKAPNQLAKIKGVTCRTGRVIFAAPDRPFVKDMDELPFLAYELLDMAKILPHSHNFADWWPIHSGRGCCYDCKFCASVGQWKRTLRTMSPRRVMDEIDYCRQQYHIQRCFFYELTFSINKPRVLQLCRLMKNNGIKWGCRTRVDDVNPAILKEMRRAGCERIVYGVESFSDRMLKLMGKTYTAAAAAKALNESHSTGIQSYFQVMLGFPGENEETLRETVEAIREIPKGIICNAVNIFQLHPGSPMYALTKKLGMIDDEAWFKGFKMEDFIRIYYPAEFIKKITRARDEIKKITRHKNTGTSS